MNEHLDTLTLESPRFSDNDHTPSDRPVSLRSLRPTEDELDHKLMFEHVGAALFGRSRGAVQIGKYVVIRRLGVGGMGEVYLCRDPDLARMVAVKRVLNRDDPTLRSRFRREALALGLLNHRNVVQVYDSGEHEGSPYIAMEYVEGQTLSEWAQSGARSWREVLDVFCEAGRGLAAAHAAGLVHRDFKPANVLLGTDGIVRVADFGVAAGSGPQSTLMSATKVGKGDGRLTMAGSVIGTQLYMPLEQLLGEPADARSDQFAFCVSLYEALWGEFPHDSTSIQARTTSLERDSPTPPRSHADLFRVIRRGLARDSDARWPDMAALIDALERVPRRRRRLRAGLVAVPLFGLAVGALVALWPAPKSATLAQTHCSDMASARGTDSTEERVATLDARFDAAASRPHWTQLKRELERWDEGHRELWRSTCDTIDVDDAPDPALERPARRRFRCLLDQSDDIQSLLTALETSNAAGLRELLEDGLPSPLLCANPSALPPLDEPEPAQGEALTKLEPALGEVLAMRQVGNLDGAREAATALVEQATNVGYDPFTAQVYAELGKIEERRGALELSAAQYERALELASDSHHITLKLELLFMLGELNLYAGQFRDATRDYARAQEIVDTYGLQPPHRLAFGNAKLATADGELDLAQKYFEDAIRGAQADQSPALPAYLSAFATFVESNQPELAKQLREQAWTAASDRFGATHPRTAHFMYEYGLSLGVHDEQGRALRTRAVEIWEALDEPLYNVRIEHERAQQSLNAHDIDGAVSRAEAMVRLCTTPELAQSSYCVVDAELTLSKAYALEGELDRSIRHARTAVKQAAHLPPGNRDRLRAEFALANRLLQRGGPIALDEAETLLRSQLDYVDGPQSGERRLAIAEIALRENKLGEARRHLDVAREQLTTDKLVLLELLDSLTALREGEAPSTTARARAAATAFRTTYANLYDSWLDSLKLTPSEWALFPPPRAQSKAPPTTP